MRPMCRDLIKKSDALENLEVGAQGNPVHQREAGVAALGLPPTLSRRAEPGEVKQPLLLEPSTCHASSTSAKHENPSEVRVAADDLVVVQRQYMQHVKQAPESHILLRPAPKRIRRVLSGDSQVEASAVDSSQLIEELVHRLALTQHLVAQYQRKQEVTRRARLTSPSHRFVEETQRCGTLPPTQ